MNNSLSLGKPFGIDLKVHWTFLLLPLWVLISTLVAGGSTVAALSSVFLITTVFGCVVLHEIGHALAARRYGIGTRDIVLYPIGGVASLERIPRKPVQELVIALAGPMVNVVIAAILLMLTGLVSMPALIGSFVWQLALINIGLVVFNLIPAFPMDGGRVLRSLLAMMLPYERATQVAATVGQWAAIGFGLLGLYTGQWMLLLVAAFVYLAAGSEAAMVRRSSQRKPWSQQTLHREYQENSQQPLISADWTMLNALRWLASRAATEFRVIKNGQIIGFATQAELRYAVADGKGSWPVESLFLAA